MKQLTRTQMRQAIKDMTAQNCPDLVWVWTLRVQGTGGKRGTYVLPHRTIPCYPVREDDPRKAVVVGMFLELFKMQHPEYEFDLGLSTISEMQQKGYVPYRLDLDLPYPLRGLDVLCPSCGQVFPFDSSCDCIDQRAALGEIVAWGPAVEIDTEAE